jgi:SAM-dependent methyltransferase
MQNRHSDSTLVAAGTFTLRGTNEMPSSEFEDIYETNAWGIGSGVGSLPLNNIEYMKFIQEFILRNKVASIVDLGCGDWQFSRFMDWSGVKYTGIDVVSRLVEENRRQYGNDSVEFKLFSTVNDVPSADLLLCKDLLQHLPNELIKDYLRRLKPKFRYLLLTNDEWPTELNSDIPIGGWRPIRLDQAPFSESAPVVLSWTVTWGGWRPTQKSTSLICGSRAGYTPPL